MTKPAEAQTEAPSAPRHWEADVLLRDGRTAHIRPIRPDDAERLVDFYSRVSPESKYLRFFTPMPKLSKRDVERFTHVDHVKRVAFVMTLSDRIIALGSYEADDLDKAEVAFLVEDAQQGRGIGQLLLEHLAQAGRERGVQRFVAEVLPDNQRMIQTFRDAGYRLVSDIEDGVMALEFPIESDRHRRRRDGQPRAPRRVQVDRDLLQPAFGGGHRRQPPAGHHRPGAGPQPRAG